MRDTMYINLLCPRCGNTLKKIIESSKGNWVTTREIKCENKECKVCTGKQPTLSDAYEALAYIYFGAQSKHEYTAPKDEDDADETELKATLNSLYGTAAAELHPEYFDTDSVTGGADQ